MKNLLLLLFAGMFTLTSCSKDDDDNNTTTAVAANLKSGTWRVSSFIDNGTDETTDFNGFTFTYNNGGTVSAVNNILTVTGSWSTGTDDSRAKLNLDFSSSSLSQFEELSEDWEIVSQSATQVSLRHVSGGSGETDLLVFQKN